MKYKERQAKNAASLKAKKRAASDKLDLLRKSWNPLPVRGQIEKRLNFINCKQRIFNVGKYKGIDVTKVPLSYISWVKQNIKLNDTELQLLKQI